MDDQNINLRQESPKSFEVAQKLKSYWVNEWLEKGVENGKVDITASQLSNQDAERQEDHCLGTISNTTE